MKIIHKATGIIGLALMTMTSVASDLKLEDMSLTMSRDEADACLDKDYSFRILEDFTIRRSWKLKGKTVHADFKTGGDLICVAVEYDKPTTAKKLKADMKSLTGLKPELSKKSPKKTMGMKNVRQARVTLPDGTKMSEFYAERNSSKKYTRFICYTSASPKDADRLALGDASVAGSGFTAMGSKAGSSDAAETIAILTQDEEERRSKAPTRTPSGKKFGTDPASETESDPAEELADEMEDEEETALDTEETTSAEPVATEEAATEGEDKGFLPENVSAPVRKMLSDCGLQLSAMVVDVLIVALPLLLLLIVCSMISKRNRKKRQQMAYEFIANKAPQATGKENAEGQQGEQK